MATLKGNNQQKESLFSKITSAAGVAGMVIVLLVMFSYNFVVENNSAGQYTMIEPFSSKDMYEPVMKPGRFIVGLNTPHTWDRSSTYWFSFDPTEGAKADESVPVRYNDGGTAKVSGSVRYEIGYDETNEETKNQSKEKFTKLHIQYRDQDNFQDRAIRSLVTEALTITATLMSAEESYTASKAQFTQWALDQLNNGVYLTDSKMEIITLPSGEVKKIPKNEIRRDPKTNEPMRKEYALKDFEIEFSQFVISDPEYHQMIKDQIAGKLKNLMGKVASSAEAELKAVEETTAIIEGQRDVMISKYDQAVINIKDTIEAEIEAAKKRIPAEARNIVSKIKKEAAEHQKNADIYNGQGEASMKEALQSADNNMEIRLKLWLEGHKAKAMILANNKKIQPDVVLPESGSQAETGMAILNYKALKSGM